MVTASVKTKSFGTWLILRFNNTQISCDTMHGGFLDMPLAHWGVVFIDRGCGAPMALIPYDFVVAGWRSAVGL